MTYVITQPCCNDATCVPACPVNCIHPTPDEPGFATAEQLYIDPGACIECGACVDVCPVNAIHPDYELPEGMEPFAELNANWYEGVARPDAPQVRPQQALPSVTPVGGKVLRVAVVGSGPAACYFVEECVRTLGASVEVNLFERLPVIGGLVRHGVAPDHQSTKSVGDRFASTLRGRNVNLFLNCEVGRTISHDELLEHHHAVVYGTGAAAGAHLGIPGEHLPGHVSSHEFVSWYNGHPDYADVGFDFSHETAVIIGNGNVALDVARILTASPRELASTDIADHALDQLSTSNIRSVLVVARRGPQCAAFTTGELVGLTARPSVGVVVSPDEVDEPALGAPVVPGPDAYKLRMIANLDRETERDRVISLRFGLTPRAIEGEGMVEGVAFARTAHATGADGRPGRGEERLRIDCGLVVSSLGYRGQVLPDIPYDDGRGTVANQAGRVWGEDGPIRGTYVVGWAKRGSSGGVGSNRQCAGETLRAVLEDFDRGHLTSPRGDVDFLREALAGRQVVHREGWQTIDAHERAAGRQAARPRVKLVSIEEMLETAARSARQQDQAGRRA